MSVILLQAVQKPVATKLAGAYRPPGARGLATPAFFKREDEGGPGSGSSTPPRYDRSPVPGAPGYGQQQNGGQVTGNGHHQGQNGSRRHVPGAPPNGSSPAQGQNKKRKGKKDGGGEGRGEDGEQAVDGPVNGNGGQGQKDNGSSRQDGQGSRGKRQPQSNDVGGGTVSLQFPPAATVPDLETSPGADSTLDPAAKKARNLNKKLKAIEELKDKAKRGERLEVTQLRKIEGEVEIRKELAALEL